MNAQTNGRLEAITGFLDFLGDALGVFAFQTFDDNKARNDKKRSKTIIGTFDECRRDLVEANRDRFAVHVTINDTAGKRRVNANVVRVRKHFVEIDGDHSLEEIHGIAADRGLNIAWINESSPGKYHVYFNVADDVAADLDGFTYRQKQLAKAFDGGNESVDLPRVLRVPGFYHAKGAPFLVRTVFKNADASKHTLQDFDIALADIAVETAAAEPSGAIVHEEDQTAIDRSIEHYKTFPEAISKTPNGKMDKKGNNQTYDAIAFAKDYGLDKETNLELVLKHYNPRCKPKWSYEELQTLVDNVYSYTRSPQGSKHPSVETAAIFAEPIDENALNAMIVLTMEHDRKQKKIKEALKSSAANLETIRADSVKMQIIDWLWGGHLALGQHTCLAGVQGDGKSQLVYSIIAAITTGACWPGSNEAAPIGNCIVLSAEDTDKDVLVPRLKAAGADLTRVHIIKSRRDEHGKRNKVLLQRDIKLIEAKVKEIGNVKLISVDPISSYLGGDIDSHNNTELRAALDPITEMAEATGCAVISITHFNKASKGITAMNRIMGSVAFVAAPRAAFVVLRDDEDDDRRLFLPVKLNLASVEEAYGMAFEIEVVDTGVIDERNGKSIIAPRVKWLERVGKTADAVLAAQDKTGDGTSPITEAMAWLSGQLAFAPMLRSVIKEEVEGADLHTWATMRRAAKKLGVISRKRPQADGHGPYEWMLPEVAADVAAEPDMTAKPPPSYQPPKGNPHEECL